jgi:hypothetical protein
VRERYEGLREFFASQRQEIEATHEEPSKARLELEEHLKETLTREQHIADDEA